ncbi:hypothetical protein YC2023_040020 [Brassica napus]
MICFQVWHEKRLNGNFVGSRHRIIRLGDKDPIPYRELCWPVTVLSISSKFPNEEKSDIRTYQNAQIYYERETSSEDFHIVQTTSWKSRRLCQKTSKKSRRLPDDFQTTNRRMSCALILWIILIDAVLLRCFGLYGSQDQKEGVTWSLGIWMWLRTVLYGLAAQTQSLWLVSLNQLQKRDLELGLVIVLEMKENQWCRTYVNGFMGISCRRYTGFVPINFVSWCHGLEIEICIKNGHVNQRKGMAFFELFPYHAWKIVYTIWRRKHEKIWTEEPTSLIKNMVYGPINHKILVLNK